MPDFRCSRRRRRRFPPSEITASTASGGEPELITLAAAPNSYLSIWRTQAVHEWSADHGLSTAAFAPLMTGDRATLQAYYVGLSPYRVDAPEQPSVIALPVPEPHGQRRVAGYAIEKSMPDGVGAS